jgi:hypothetical protein
MCHIRGDCATAFLVQSFFFWKTTCLNCSTRANNAAFLAQSETNFSRLWFGFCEKRLNFFGFGEKRLNFLGLLEIKLV